MKNESLGAFAKNVRKYLEVNKHWRGTQIGAEETRSPKQGDEKSLKELRNVFYRNGITGFTLKDTEQIGDFVDRLTRETFDYQLKTLTDSEGKTLKSGDRDAVLGLMKSGVINSNFEMYIINKVIDPLKAIGMIGTPNVKDAPIKTRTQLMQNELKLLKEKVDEVDFSKIEGGDTFKTAILDIAKKVGESPENVVNDILTKYNNLTSRFMVTDDSKHGFIKPGGMEGAVTNSLALEHIYFALQNAGKNDGITTYKYFRERILEMQ